MSGCSGWKGIMTKHIRKKKKKRETRRKAQTISVSNGVLKSDAGSLPAEQAAKPKPYQVPPPKKEVERKNRDKGSAAKYFRVTVQFLRECKMELKKVKWPTRKELLASTAVVIILVLIVSFFLGTIDFVLIWAIRRIVG
jgi:preprotein translocase subunit SecE